MRFMNPFDRLLWWRRRATDSAPSAPTVIADLNYLTDTILNDVLSPAGNLDALSSWAAATGGTFTKALAVAAGASGVDGPFYVTASGVHTGGVNVALTAATPVTIPALATADWDIWVYCVLPESGSLIVASKASAPAFPKLVLTTGSGPVILDDNGDGASDETDTLTSGVKLVRIGNVLGTLSAAWTGSADHTLNNEGYRGAFSFDTILALIGFPSYSDAGAYLKVLRIDTYPTGYADRASHRSAVETAIAGAALT